MLWLNFSLCTIFTFLLFYGMLIYHSMYKKNNNNNKLIQLEFIESQHIQPMKHPFQLLNLLKTLIKFMFC